MQNEIGVISAKNDESVRTVNAPVVESMLTPATSLTLGWVA